MESHHASSLWVHNIILDLPDSSASDLDLDCAFPLTKLDLGVADLGGLTTETVQLPRKDQKSEQIAVARSPFPLLHHACQSFPTNKEVIETALMQDTRAANFPAVGLPILFASKANGGDGKLCWRSRPGKKTVRKDFQYPINIAINNGATNDVVKVLAHAAPEILLMHDGVQGLTTLQIALMKQPKNHKLIRILLQANSLAAFILTKRKDTLLHMACQKGCPLAVVRVLYNAHNGAVDQENFHGETPIQVAGRTMICPEEVVNYLEEQR